MRKGMLTIEFGIIMSLVIVPILLFLTMSNEYLKKDKELVEYCENYGLYITIGKEYTPNNNITIIEHDNYIECIRNDNNDNYILPIEMTWNF